MAEQTEVRAELYVVPADHTQLYINNIAWSTSEETLNSFFTEKIGTAPTQINIAVSTYKKSTGRSRGFGFITVPNAFVQNALAVTGTELEGRELSIVEARPRSTEPAAPREPRERKPRAAKVAAAPAEPREPREPRAPRAPREPKAPREATASDDSTPRAPRAPRVERKTYDTATQLYVNNLPWEVTAEQLTELLSNTMNGVAPVEVELVTRKYGKFAGSSRGFGFVVVPNTQLDAVLTLHETEQFGRVINVLVARPPTDTPAEGTEQAPRARKPRKPRAPRAQQDGEEQQQAGSDEQRRR